MDRKLIEYLPEFLREFREMKFLTDKEQVQAERLWKTLESIWQNQFIETLGEEGCRRWEGILKIHHRGYRSLKERRDTILSKMAEQRPFTIRTLRRTLTALCGEDGFDIMLIPEEYFLQVRVRVAAETTDRDAKGLLRAVDDYVERVKPCNLTYDSSLFDRHTGIAGSYYACAVSTSKTYTMEVAI